MTSDGGGVGEDGLDPGVVEFTPARRFASWIKADEPEPEAPIALSRLANLFTDR
jgi:hypothetical protein